MSETIREEFVRTGEKRPWGLFMVLAEDAEHKVKRIVVAPGQRLSLQRHARRREHWLVVSGRAAVIMNEQRIDLGPGDSLDIATGAAHRVWNRGNEDLVFIEIQLGEYFGEDDVERLEDDYNRIPKV